MRALIILLILTPLFSCGPDLPDGDLIIKELYNERVAEYISQKDRDCRKDAIADAEEHVDSIVHRMLNADLVDSLAFPNRPVKPVRPKPIIGKVQKFELEEN